MTTFKPLSVSDIDKILQMLEEFYAIDHYPFEIETSTKLFHQFIENENLGKAWLIFDENEIVGYAILTFVFSFEYQGRIAFLDELYIKKSAQGKGFGKQTLHFIRQEAHKLSLKIIYLEVEPHNHAAQKLYIANDFEEHKRKLFKYTVQ
ncbi:GNAT family N-acetyltransferase [Flavobacterium filum]|uniref:GNAT family N-acetyltransferase n=1 Tax=Flavobacterium TaxID=237 RepID=UPI0004047B38|nr:GNAT family N-acetyltransferase [Flavobacterium filum]